MEPQVRDTVLVFCVPFQFLPRSGPLECLLSRSDLVMNKRVRLNSSERSFSFFFSLGHPSNKRLAWGYVITPQGTFRDRDFSASPPTTPRTPSFVTTPDRPHRRSVGPRGPPTNEWKLRPPPEPLR